MNMNEHEENPETILYSFCVPGSATLSGGSPFGLRFGVGWQVLPEIV